MEWIENQKVAVTANDTGGLAAYCKLKKFVVFWIDAFCDFRGDVHHFSCTNKSCEKQESFLFMQVTVEFRTTKHCIQFVEVSADARTIPLANARSTACRGTDRGNRTALTRTPVSMTKRGSFVTKDGPQDFRCQTAGLCLGSDVVHDFSERV